MLFLSVIGYSLKEVGSNVSIVFFTMVSLEKPEAYEASYFV